MKEYLRRHRRALITVGAVGSLALGALVAIPAVNAFAATGCSVNYTVNTWPGGFTASIDIKNLGEAVDGWTLGFTFADAGQKVDRGWSATYTQSGASVTAASMGYNGALATGASTNIGFSGAWTSANPTPTGFTLNGTSCTGSTSGSATGSAAASVTAPASSSPASSQPPSSPAASRSAPASSPAGSSAPPTGTTPVAINGQLHVCGTNLCNQYGKPVQLRGMSTHGLQWFANCYTNASLDALANDWKADVLRIAMYVDEKGYMTNPGAFTDQVNTLVDMAEARGMYALIDFHILSPGDPNVHTSDAKTFFTNVATRNASKKNVIYEIANEPNGVNWSTIRNYANQVVPVIRGIDSDAVIVVGTMGWSSLGVSGGGSYTDVVNSPIADKNVMYTFHFYAASHGDQYRSALSAAAAKLPIFVTEFGTVTASGGGSMDRNSSTTWLNLLDSLKISYANWTFSDADESSAAFKSGTCAAGSFTSSGQLTESGSFIRDRIRTADNFPTN